MGRCGFCTARTTCGTRTRWSATTCSSLIYGALSAALFITGDNGGRWWFWVGVGIAAYGTVYFFVHDVLIHGRLRFWKKSQNTPTCAP